MSLIDTVQFHPIGDLEYAVRETGPADGEPLICLHGLMDTGASFDGLARAIDARAPGHYRIIAPDWRGHGRSTATRDSYWFPLYLLDLERLLNTLIGDTPATLIAHSMGGQVAALYAGTRPTRISHLISLDSLNVPDAEIDDVPERYRRWLDAHARPQTARVYDDLQTAGERIGKRYPELSADQTRFLAEQWTEREDDTDRRRMRVDPWHRVPLPYGFRAAEAMALWRQVTAAVLCIDGGDSPAGLLTPDEEMQQRRACFANLQRTVIEGCGHMLHVQQPDAVAAEICAFLDRRD